jgi:hypothetical protein
LKALQVWQHPQLLQKESFNSGQNVTYRNSNEMLGGMSVIIVKKEALSGDESALNCDSSEEFYESVNTSLPMVVVYSELRIASKTPDHGFILLTLLLDSTLKNYLQVYKDEQDLSN